MTGLIDSAERNTQKTPSGNSVMVMAGVKPTAITYVMLVNPFAMDAVKTVQIHG